MPKELELKKKKLPINPLVAAGKDAAQSVITAPLKLVSEVGKGSDEIPKDIQELEKKLVIKGDKEKSEQDARNKEFKKLTSETLELKKKTKALNLKNKPKKEDFSQKVISITKDVAKNEENVQGKKLFSDDDIENAALGLIPVLIGGLLGGADGALMGVQAGAAGIQAKADIEADEEAAATAKELKEKELDTEAKEQKSKQALREAQISESSSKVFFNQAKAVAEKAKSKAKQGERFIKDIGTARTDDDAKELKTFTANHNKSIGLINSVRELGDNINVLDRKDIAKIQSNLALLVGSLRIDVVGPGAFTDSEREFIKEIVGDPSKIVGAESIEFAKLEQLLKTKEKAFIDQINLRTTEGYLGPSEEERSEREDLERLRKRFK